ncbi:MAG: GFA family protein [Spongiibacteraceae bacterium]|nr:GFA family protein [Spongiibacteraceae bacterium]
MCRNWGGGPFLGVDCASDVEFNGYDNITVFDSSAWGERGFCKACGSHLFYRLKESNQYIVPVGLFENTDAFVLDHQVFIEEKPEFYCFSNETKNMTGEELFAEFSS